MDSKELRSLWEAYASVYTPQEVEEGVRDVDPEKGTAERKAKLEKKRGMKLDDHPEYKKEEVEVAEARKPGESPKEYAARMTKKHSGGKSKTYDPMKDPNFDHDKAERTRGSMQELYKGKHGQSEKEYADSRSQGGKMVSGDSKGSGAEYTHGRRVKAANPGMQPDVGGKTKPKSQGKMDKGTRADLEYRKANLKKEELDIFDIVLEFLYAEGYVDTAEEAEWMMANLIDKEAIDIILGEDSRRMSNKQHTARVRSNIKSFGKNYTPPSNYDPDANRGQGEVLTRKQIEKKRRKALRQEEFEAWFDEAMMEADSLAAMQARREKRLAAQRKREGTTSTGRDFGHDYGISSAERKKRQQAEFDKFVGKKDKKEEVEVEVDEAMSSYDRNRKRAAQRAAARNAARDAGKTGVVPGVGYVSPRKERETYTDEKGTVRHKSGAKMP